MHLETKSRTLAALAVFMLTGCAGFAHSIGRDETPSSEDAYIYGRFSMSSDGSPYWYSSMGLHFACENKEKEHSEYTIDFSGDDPIQVIRIPEGGRCSLVGLNFGRFNEPSSWVNASAHRSPLSSASMAAIHFDAGRAYYLGDFSGACWKDPQRDVVHWELTGLENHFESTTAEMRDLFHNMSGFPTEDKFSHWTQRSESKEGSTASWSGCTDTPEFQNASAVEKKRILERCRQQP